MSEQAEASVRAYEALRSHVLDGSSPASHAGLLVLLRQGVAAWMARRLACACSAPAGHRPGTLLVGEQMHAALVPVLASMALGAQQEIRV